ncbi:cell division protein FtsL [Ensifer soli]|uniref:cell division protein FtsL n=1 Tax=Ciceribacter sp. sgz301302 TaxID=3342379 RepID=UPI0035B779C7
MLRTLDVVLIVVMTAAATVTYTIKHRAENIRDEVRRLDANIKLEEDTIDLLKADWALLTQPNRLERLVAQYGEELKLSQTLSTALARPEELPMLTSQLPQEEVKTDAIADLIKTGSVKN